MARTLNEVVASLPRRERMKIEARADTLIAEEMSLRDLRKAIGKDSSFPTRAGEQSMVMETCGSAKSTVSNGLRSARLRLRPD